MVLIHEDSEKLGKIAQESLRKCGRIDFQVNISKTKYMSNTEDTHLRVGEHRIEKVYNYTYLGQNICIISKKA